MVEMEIGSFPPITLAPILAKKGLKLPVALLEASGCPYWEGPKVFMAFGLSREQASLLQREIVGRGDFSGILDLYPPFEAIPKDSQLPAVSPPKAYIHKNDFSKKKDMPELGAFFFEICVRFEANSDEIEKLFLYWFGKQKKALGFGPSKKRRRSWPFFVRDLIVFSLSRQIPKWTIADIDILLSHIGLPMLKKMRKDEPKKDEFRKGELKMIRRKIVFDVRRLIDRYKRMPVFRGRPKRI
jgi:hypothetical protein